VGEAGIAAEGLIAADALIAAKVNVDSAEAGDIAGVEVTPIDGARPGAAQKLPDAGGAGGNAGAAVSDIYRGQSESWILAATGTQGRAHREGQQPGSRVIGRRPLSSIKGERLAAGGHCGRNWNAAQSDHAEVGELAVHVAGGIGQAKDKLIEHRPGRVVRGGR